MFADLSQAHRSSISLVESGKKGEISPPKVILLAKSSHQRTDAAEGRDGGRIARRFRLVSDFASSINDGESFWAFEAGTPRRIGKEDEARMRERARIWIPFLSLRSSRIWIHRQ